MSEKQFFTEKDFTTVLHKVSLKIGMNVIWQGKAAKVISTTGSARGPEYCVLELEEADEHGCKVLEVKKSGFNYLEHLKEN